ncbi:MAG: hypothetical protein BWY42_01510 [Candidatus Omnitrophica bacterium ADurb.Bin277]|nr:MAG: hypothetical protein BWY42_01510 [Candidatus Omnitrophica bacterium ADurb.Bin277]
MTDQHTVPVDRLPRGKKKIVNPCDPGSKTVQSAGKRLLQKLESFQNKPPHRLHRLPEHFPEIHDSPGHRGKKPIRRHIRKGHPKALNHQLAQACHNPDNSGHQGRVAENLAQCGTEKRDGNAHGGQNNRRDKKEDHKERPANPHSLPVRKPLFRNYLRRFDQQVSRIAFRVPHTEKLLPGYGNIRPPSPFAGFLISDLRLRHVLDEHKMVFPDMSDDPDAAGRRLRSAGGLIQVLQILKGIPHRREIPGVNQRGPVEREHGNEKIPFREFVDGPGQDIDQD